MGGERNLATSDGGGGIIKINWSVVAKNNIILLKRENVAKNISATCHLSQINKVFIHTSTNILSTFIQYII